MTDTAPIKAAHPLRAFLEGRGLKFSSAAYGAVKSRCPFHAEKSSSFMVYADHHYHCYGCGAHGDIFTYLKEVDGLDFKEAVERLTGRTAEALLSVRKPATSRDLPKPPADDMPLHAMTERELDNWKHSCDRVLLPQHLDHWAEWRGLNPALLTACAQAGLIGAHPYMGQTREAFLIEAPPSAFSPPVSPCLIPHSVHVRLAPGSIGNDSKSVSWRYDPASGKTCRTVSFPFILSRPKKHNMPEKFHVEHEEQTISYRYHLFTEGQWDALALADALGWHRLEDIPANTVIVGLRGATSWRRYLEFCLPAASAPGPRPVALCFGDNDRAGEQWFAPNGFIDQLREVCTDVAAYRPTSPGCKDLNDLWRTGQLDSTDLRHRLRLRLGAPAASQPVKAPFLSHLRSLRRDPTLQPAISHVLSDPHHPASSRPAFIWTSYLSNTPYASQLLDLWRLWLAA